MQAVLVDHLVNQQDALRTLLLQGSQHQKSIDALRMELKEMQLLSRTADNQGATAGSPGHPPRPAKEREALSVLQPQKRKEQIGDLAAGSSSDPPKAAVESTALSASQGLNAVGDLRASAGDTVEENCQPNLMQHSCMRLALADPHYPKWEFEAGKVGEQRESMSASEIVFLDTNGDTDELHLAFPTSTVACGGKTIDLIMLLDVFSTFLVLSNALFTAVQVNKMIEHFYEQSDRSLHLWIQVVDLLYSALFSMELLFRWWLLGSFIFFHGRDWAYNVLDIVFVATAFIDIAASFADISFMRVLQIVRVLRAFRALRGMRGVRPLRLMVAAIMSSMASFMWGLVLLGFVLFFFAVFIMQMVIMCAEVFNVAVTQEVWDAYGTVVTSMMTLFQAVSGGKDWDDLVQPLLGLTIAFRPLFIFYIAVMLLGFMNVLMAVFVENASQIAHIDNDLVINNEVERMQNDLRKIKQFFVYADSNKDGKLTTKELEHFLSVPERVAMLNLLQIDVAETRGLFQLLDEDNSGSVDLDQYVDYILRLRGAAKGCDTALLLFENKRMLIRLASFMCYTCDCFENLFQTLNVDGKEKSLEQYMNQDVLKQKEAESKARLKAEFASHLGRHSASVTGDEENLGFSHRVTNAVENVRLAAKALQPQSTRSHSG